MLFDLLMFLHLEEPIITKGITSAYSLSSGSVGDGVTARGCDDQHSKHLQVVCIDPEVPLHIAFPEPTVPDRYLLPMPVLLIFSLLYDRLLLFLVS